MSTNNKPSQSNHYGSITPLVIGFVLSVLLTLGSYFLVEQNLFPQWILGSVLTLAMIQLIVQLVFFLHLSQEKAPRWQLIFFLATVSIILLVVLGSLWIMHHLNYNMMPEHMEEFLIQDEGIKISPTPTRP